MSNATETTPATIEIWKALLPEDLRFGTFELGFVFEGGRCEFGAWDANGVPVLGWNTSDELDEQLFQLEMSAAGV